MGTVINVAILDEKGDARAMPAMMGLAGTTNTDASNALSWYFSEVLCGNPQRFLNAVRGRSDWERANLIYLAAIGDSKNAGCLSITALRQELQTTAKNNDVSLARLASETLLAVNKWSRPNPNTGDCFVKSYRFKSEKEILTMTPRQLVEEDVQSEIHTPEYISKAADYGQLTNKYLRKNALVVLPILTEYINAYDPTKRASCDEVRYSTASHRLWSIDLATLRLRGVYDGKLAINAVKNAIDRMKKAGFEAPGVQSPLSGSLLDLPQLTGTNIRDYQIRDTLRTKNHVEMSDEEFENFVEYLISIDPRYPSWSRLEPGYKVRPLLVDSRRFLQAYRQFKRRTQN